MLEAILRKRPLAPLCRMDREVKEERRTVARGLESSKKVALRSFPRTTSRQRTFNIVSFQKQKSRARALKVHLEMHHFEDEILKNIQ